MNRRAFGLGVSTALLAVLCGLLLILSRPEPPILRSEDLFLWRSDAEAIQSLAVHLPRLGQSAAWEKRPDNSWRFADPSNQSVDHSRWAGIPLLVSSVRADRLIVSDADQADLTGYGFDQPGLVVDVGYADGSRRTAEIGNETPSGSGDYARIAGSTDVFLLNPAWRDVLERLVTDPPHQRGSGAGEISGQVAP